MNTDTPGTDDNRQSTRRSDLRRKGMLCILAGLVFLLQWLFHLDDKVMSLLISALVFIYTFYVFLVLGNTPAEQPPVPFGSKILRFAMRSAAFLAVFFLAILVLTWLWRTAGVPRELLFAGAFVLVGTILLGWGCAPDPKA